MEAFSASPADITSLLLLIITAGFAGFFSLPVLFIALGPTLELVGTLGFKALSFSIISFFFAMYNLLSKFKIVLSCQTSWVVLKNTFLYDLRTHYINICSDYSFKKMLWKTAF